jgi:eukaryotic-like serine/threonine-protein kinase
MSITPRSGQPKRVIDGRYEIKDRLGQGSFGTVWRGVICGLGTQVAIKEMAGAAPDSPEAARIERESKIPARVGVGVAKCIELFEWESHWFLVMEYISGPSLATVLRDQVRCFSALNALRIALQAVTTLEAAHAKGLIHRDVTPPNLLLSEWDPTRQSCRVCLIDWGISRDHDPSDPQQMLTQTGPAGDYLPPEGREFADPKFDIYILGAVLYQMLTGGLPERADGSRRSELVWPLDPAVPLPVRQLVENCLANAVRHRPDASVVKARMGRIIEELERIPFVELEARLSQSELARQKQAGEGRVPGAHARRSTPAERDAGDPLTQS